jgi:hypothetical protein
VECEWDMKFKFSAGGGAGASSGGRENVAWTGKKGTESDFWRLIEVNPLRKEKSGSVPLFQ